MRLPSPKARWIGLLLVSSGLSACATPQVAERSVPVAADSLASARSFSASYVAQSWPSLSWWRTYGDAQLDAIMAEALASSPDVAIADAKLRQAQAIINTTASASRPQMGVGGEGVLTKQSYQNGIPAAFLPQGWNDHVNLYGSGSFDLDLWGKNKVALATATSDALAAEVDAQQARVMLTSAVATTYADLARLFAERDVLTAEFATRQGTADLILKRQRAGLENMASVHQAQAAVDGARLLLEANDEAMQLRRHALAALMGKGPDRGLSIARPSAQLTQPTPLPADAGIALIGRRPDIVAARVRVESADLRITSAQKAFLPDIKLQGLLGLQALGIGNLFGGGADYGQFGPAFSLPIFDGGTLQANLDAQSAAYDMAVAGYNKTVIAALNEVADAIASRDSADRQLAAADSAAQSAAASYDLIRKRYGAGLASYLDVLATEGAMLEAKRAASQARYRRLALDIALIRALGGGFSEADVTEFKG